MAYGVVSIRNARTVAVHKFTMASMYFFNWKVTSIMHHSSFNTISNQRMEL